MRGSVEWFRGSDKGIGAYVSFGYENQGGGKTMLQINMADVMNVIGSLTPYLIAIGVLFALALIITFAVNKKTVKDVAYP